MARAKLRFSNEVSSEDVLDCLELIEESQTSIVPEKPLKRPKVDYMSAIFEIIKDRCNYSEGKAEDLDVIRNRVLLRGYNEVELNKTL